MEVVNKGFSPGAEGLLAPLLPWLQDKSVSEILVNQPQEIYVERCGLMQRFVVEALSAVHLKRLFLFIANENNQLLNEHNPLLSGNLYDGTRIQLVIPPAAPHYTLAIRRASVPSMQLSDYAPDFYNQAKAFDPRLAPAAYAKDEDKTLLALYKQAAWQDFIAKAIAYKKTLVISGETSSGKTTFLNACVAQIPPHERLITLEDTYEIKAPHSNKVSLLATKKTKAQGSSLSMQDLVQCALRLRPDRLIMGELRGAEVLDFVSAGTTGHEGAMTTLHAPNPRVAFLRMVQMYKLNTVPSMRDSEIAALLHEVIDIIVQVKKTLQGRQLVYVYYKQAERL